MDVQNKLSSVSTSLVTNLKNPNSKTFKFVLSIVSIVILLSVIFSILKYRKFKKNNPRFYKEGKDTKKEDIIKADKFVRPADELSFTLFMWLYVDNMSYLYGDYKHILTKGFKGNNLGVCPSMYIHSTQNDIVVWISTKNGGVEEVILADFPIRKWFSIALIIQSSSVDILMNGKLVISKPLPNIPKINNGPIYVNSHGGFPGQMTGLNYFNTPLSMIQIMKIHSTGPYGNSFLENVYNYMTGITKGLKNSVKKSYRVITEGDDKRAEKIKMKNMKLYKRSAPHNFWEWLTFRMGKQGSVCDNSDERIEQCDFKTAGIELLHAITCDNKDNSKGVCRSGLTLKQAIEKYGKTGFVYIPIEKGYDKKNPILKDNDIEQIINECKIINDTNNGKYNGECNIIIPVTNSGSKDTIRKGSRRSLSNQTNFSIEDFISSIFDNLSNYSWGYYISN